MTAVHDAEKLMWPANWHISSNEAHIHAAEFENAAIDQGLNFQNISLDFPKINH